MNDDAREKGKSGKEEDERVTVRNPILDFCYD